MNNLQPAKPNGRRSRDPRNASYEEAYEQWIASLPESKRRQLAAMGLDKPESPDTQIGGLVDAAELAHCDAAEPADELSEIEREPTNNGTHTPIAKGTLLDLEDVHDLLRRLVGELLGLDDVRLSVACLALVTGIAYGGDSLADIARRHGLSRAAVSKRCIELTRPLRIKPSRAMRPLNNRRACHRARAKRLDQNETRRSQ